MVLPPRRRSTNSDDSARLYLDFHRLAKQHQRQSMPGQRISERRRRRVPGPAVSTGLAALPTSTGRLPRQATTLPFACRVIISPVRFRGSLASSDLRHYITPSRSQPHTFADSHASDNHYAVGHHLRRLRGKHRRRDAPSPLLERNVVPTPGFSCRCDSAGAEAKKFVPPEFAQTATKTRPLRRVMQSSQVVTRTGRHPPQDHTDSFRRRSTPSVFSCCGNIKRDAKPPSRRFAHAAAHHAATQAASRRGRRCGLRLKRRPVGSRLAAHRVRLLRSGAGEHLSGQPAAMVMNLLSGMPPGTGKEGTGWRALPRGVNIQGEMTTGGKSSLLDSPSNATRGAADGVGPRALATRDQLATLATVIGEKQARRAAERLAPCGQNRAEKPEPQGRNT